MKHLFKIVIALLLIGISLNADAQKSFSNRFNPGVTPLDTVTNTSTDTLYQSGLQSYKNSVAFQANVTSISGNPSSCKLYLQASIDGINYFNLDSATVANVSGVQAFYLPVNNGIGNPFQFYKGLWVGAGTYSASWQLYSLYR